MALYIRTFDVFRRITLTHLVGCSTVWTLTIIKYTYLTEIHNVRNYIRYRTSTNSSYINHYCPMCVHLFYFSANSDIRLNTDIYDCDTLMDLLLLHTIQISDDSSPVEAVAHFSRYYTHNHTFLEKKMTHWKVVVKPITFVFVVLVEDQRPAVISILYKELTSFVTFVFFLHPPSSSTNIPRCLGLLTSHTKYTKRLVSKWLQGRR